MSVKIKEIIDRTIDDIRKSILERPYELSEDIQLCGRPAFKPDLSDKEIVMGEGWHKLHVGDRVWLERPELAWCDTLLCEVVRILDDESGGIDLWNLAQKHHNFTNFKRPRGDVLRLGTPIKKKKKQTLEVQVSPELEQTINGPRGRGRPKGSKNRPREIVEAERRERAMARAEKKRMRRERRESKKKEMS